MKGEISERRSRWGGRGCSRVVVQVWRERSASVASLWCLAVRLGAAMGQEVGGAPVAEVQGSGGPWSLLPSLPPLFSLRVCVCVYFDVPSPPAPACDDRQAKPTSRQR